MAAPSQLSSNWRATFVCSPITENSSYASFFYRTVAVCCIRSRWTWTQTTHGVRHERIHDHRPSASTRLPHHQRPFALGRPLGRRTAHVGPDAYSASGAGSQAGQIRGARMKTPLDWIAVIAMCLSFIAHLLFYAAVDNLSSDEKRRRDALAMIWFVSLVYLFLTT